MFRCSTKGQIGRKWTIMLQQVESAGRSTGSLSELYPSHWLWMNHPSGSQGQESQILCLSFHDLHQPPETWGGRLARVQCLLSMKRKVFGIITLVFYVCDKIFFWWKTSCLSVYECYLNRLKTALSFFFFSLLLVPKGFVGLKIFSFTGQPK